MKTIILKLSLVMLVMILVGVYIKSGRYIPTADEDIVGEALSPAQIQQIRAETPITEIKVYKANRVMKLLHREQIIRSYPMRLGFSPKGHKRQEGDGKTPEGRYTIDWRNGQSEFYKSLHVSYPNKKDTLWADQLGVLPGGNIMIHGSGSSHEHPNEADLMKYLPKKDWTSGCIAVRNIDMDEVWSLVDNGTVIEIYP